MLLRRFVPDALRRLIDREEGEATASYADSLTVALMFADISGFTALMEHHAQRGPAGLEELTQILNTYFGRIVALVTRHGGDVVSFAGDALLVVWPTADDPAACHRAAQCAFAVQALEPDPRARVSMRVAVCAGRVNLLRLGGERERRCAFMVGDPLAQLAPTLKLAQPGDVAISPQARAALPGNISDSMSRGRVIRPRDLAERVDERPLALADISPERAARLRRYVPRVIREALEDPAGRPQWIAQFRQITAMFVRLPAPDEARPAWLDDYGRLFSSIQRIIYKFGGRIDKVSSEEKGILLLAVWGLPGATHEDDPLRAVQTAVHLRDLMRKRGHPVALGLATGRAYCGLVGDDIRSEYTIVGTVVNRAARIMQQADGVLCDEATRAVAEDRVEFADGRPLTIRGIAAKVVASEPVAVHGSRRRRHPETELVGRDTELATLRRCVDDLVHQRRGRNVLLVGKAGIGKSRLLEELRRNAVVQGVAVLEAVGDAVEADAPYTAIRPIVAALLERAVLDDSIPGASITATAITMTTSQVLEPDAPPPLDDPELAERAPLLEAIVPRGLVDNEFTRALSGEARAAALHALVAALLRRRADARPVLVLLDDVNWFDSASLSLARALARAVSGVLFAFAARPHDSGLPPELAELRRDYTSVALELDGLDEAGIALLLSRCLKVQPERVPAALTATIRERTDGNPLFIEQLALSLLEQGHVAVHDGACRIQTASGALSDVALPGTIHGILHSRLDLLPAPQRHLLKLASVLGRSFDLRIVRSLFAREAPDQAPDIAPLVDALEQQGIVARQGRSGHQCSFRHTTTLEAIYETLLFAHRRELHRAVAEWYETQSDDPGEHLALLAHHWSRAEDGAKARHYLELAGARALERSANAEAARLLEQLLVRVDAERVTPDPDHAARWREQLCEAHFRTSDFQASLRHGLAALAQLGVPMPGSTAGMLSALLRLIVERNLAAVPRRFPRDVPADVRARRVRALRVQHRLTDLYGYLTNVPGFLLSSIRELALAEACDEHGDAASAYLMLYFITSVTPLKRVAEPWIGRALALIDREPDRALAATALGRVGVAHLQTGDFAAAARHMQQARALAVAAGDLRVLSELYSLYGLSSMYRGLFTAGEQWFEEVGVASHFSGDEQFAGWSLIGRAACMEAQGRVDEATRTLARAVPWLEEKAAPTTYIWGQGVRALVTLRAGDRRGAADLIRIVLARLRKEKVLAAYWMHGGIEAICVAAHNLLATAADPDERRALARTARECNKFLAKFAATLPFGTAAAALQHASLARLTGDRDRELAALQRCVAHATRLDALHLLERACARLAELLPALESARAAREQADDAARRRAAAEADPHVLARDDPPQLRATA